VKVRTILFSPPTQYGGLGLLPPKLAFWFGWLPKGGLPWKIGEVLIWPLDCLCLTGGRINKPPFCPLQAGL